MAFEKPEVIEDELLSMRQMLQPLAGFLCGDFAKPGPHGLKEALQLSDWNEKLKIRNNKISFKLTINELF